MTNKYDVIIVGAGPSGSSFACNLKRFSPNTSILLLDKTEFPRYKPCGGGISPEVVNYLDFDLTKQIDFICNDVVMQANGQEYTANKYPLWMIRREKFDNFLMQKARESGVEVRTNCEVLDVANNKNECVVITKAETFQAQIVVLAHGSRSKLVKDLGINLSNKVFAAIEYEDYTNNPDGKLYITFDKVKHGYAWNFPKSDGLSLGAGAQIKGKDKKVSLPNALKDYVAEFHVNQIDKKNWHGHPIEAYNGKRNLVYNRVVLVGEIAGCVDPLTAEGIRPAIKSGFLASKIVAETLFKRDIKVLKKYNKLFHNEIGKDLRYAGIMAYFLYKFYDKVVPVIASTVAVNAFMSVFSGKNTYKDKIHFKRIAEIFRRIIFKF